MSQNLKGDTLVDAMLKTFPLLSCMVKKLARLIAIGNVHEDGQGVYMF